MISRVRWHGILLAAILIFAGVFRLALLNRPFERNAEGCAAFFGLLARNYFRYDFSTTLGVPVMSMGQHAPAIFYANHPPTTPLLVAAVHFASGYRGGYEHLPGEWQTRLPTAAFTVACIALIFVLVKKRAGPRAGLIAAALFAATPMTLLYGGFADVINPQLIFFALLTAAAYERFHDETTWRNLLWLCAGFTGAAVMDWPAFFLVPVLCVHFAATLPPRRWPWIVAFGMFSAAVFAAIYSYLAVAHGDWLWMDWLLQRRALSNVADTTRRFTLFDWLQHAVWQIAVARHTVAICALALLWLVAAAWRRFSNRADRLPALLLAWAALHVVVGRQGVYQHEWWWWPLTPGIVIAAAIALQRILMTLERRVSGRTANVSVSLLIALFAAWNARAAIVELSSVPPIGHGEMAYTAADLGNAIRQHVPPASAVMVAEADNSLALWYYADRAMKRRIWDADTFRRRIDDGTVELAFETAQPWPGPVGAVIIPKTYVPNGLGPLVHYLEARHASRPTPMFIVFGLKL